MCNASHMSRRGAAQWHLLRAPQSTSFQLNGADVCLFWTLSNHLAAPKIVFALSVGTIRLQVACGLWNISHTSSAEDIDQYAAPLQAVLAAQWLGSALDSTEGALAMSLTVDVINHADEAIMNQKPLIGFRLQLDVDTCVQGSIWSADVSGFEELSQRWRGLGDCDESALSSIRVSVKPVLGYQTVSREQAAGWLTGDWLRIEQPFRQRLENVDSLLPVVQLICPHGTLIAQLAADNRLVVIGAQPVPAERPAQTKQDLNSFMPIFAEGDLHLTIGLPDIEISGLELHGRNAGSTLSASLDSTSVIIYDSSARKPLAKGRLLNLAEVPGVEIMRNFAHASS
jgi:hypothetical protein